MTDKQALWDLVKFDKRWQKILFQVILYIGLGSLIYLLLIGPVLPKSYNDLKVGDISEERIIAPVTVLDDVATERARNAAASAVKPVNSIDPTVTETQLRLLDNIFEQAKEIVNNKQLAESDRMEALKRGIPYELQEENYRTLATMQVETISTMQLITKYTVESIMQEGVEGAPERLEAAREKINEKLVAVELASRARQVAHELARNSIVPNVRLDVEKTTELKLEAKNKVDPIYIVEGDILVDYKETINAEHLRKLEEAGLMKANAYKPYIGLGILVFIFLGTILFYTRQTKASVITQPLHLLMYFLILALNLGIMKIITLGQTLEYKEIGYLAPVGFGTMLIAMLLTTRLAYFSSILFGIIAGILYNEELGQMVNFNYTLVALLGSVVGAYVVGGASSRTNILKAGFWIALSNITVITSIYLLNDYELNWSTMLTLSIYGALSGLLSGVFTLGFMPFFEAAFGILSSVKLIELSNPNQPLLRKILVETPGTYHHSVIVGNLSEAAAEAIGANGLLARVGSYYHDVGKTKRPTFFIENQMGIDNPHDKISPQLSKTIITAHPYDGSKMLKEYKIPKAIIDIAEQHHGTTLLKFFYHKAAKENDQVREEDFRYPGPKAQFKESAIVGICDSVEAAVRSLSKPTPERIEALVRKIIKDRLDDGQFDECDLTLKELDIIHRAIVETLHGTFHSRIEYPSEADREIEVKQA